MNVLRLTEVVVPRDVKTILELLHVFVETDTPLTSMEKHVMVSYFSPQYLSC